MKIAIYHRPEKTRAFELHGYNDIPETLIPFLVSLLDLSLAAY